MDITTRGRSGLIVKLSTWVSDTKNITSKAATCATDVTPPWVATAAWKRSVSSDRLTHSAITASLSNQRRIPLAGASSIHDGSVVQGVANGIFYLSGQGGGQACCEICRCCPSFERSTRLLVTRHAAGYLRPFGYPTDRVESTRSPVKKHSSGECVRGSYLPSCFCCRFRFPAPCNDRLVLVHRLAIGFDLSQSRCLPSRSCTQCHHVPTADSPRKNGTGCFSIDAESPDD